MTERERDKLHIEMNLGNVHTADPHRCQIHINDFGENKHIRCAILFTSNTSSFEGLESHYFAVPCYQIEINIGFISPQHSLYLSPCSRDGLPFISINEKGFNL